MTEVTINFKPAAKRDQHILILGQFTNWLPELMQQSPHNNLYYYKCKLPSGFKYRYYFKVNHVDEVVLDEDKEVSEGKTNMVVVPKME